MRDWNSQARNREARLAEAAHLARGKRVQAGDAGALLEAVIEPGDRVCLEGNNQKQADFLPRRWRRSTRRASTTCTWCSRCWRCPSISTCSSAASPRKLDFSFSGPQGARIAQLLGGRPASRSARSTPTSSCSRRYFVDLTPQRRAGRRRRRPTAHGNLYTGPNTEDTPAIVEATAFKSGIVIAQVNEIVDDGCRASTSRPTGSTSWSQADKPLLHRAAVHARPGADHRDPGADGDDGDQGHLRRVRRAAAEPRHRLRHRRDRAAAADLWRVARPEGQDLPALGAQSASGADPRDRGRLGRARAFASAPSSAWRTTSRARPDVFFTGPDGSHALATARSARPPGHYACDMFIGSTLQIDLAGQLLDRDARPHRRLRRRAEHGRRRARPPPRQPGLAEGRPRGAAGAGDAARRAGSKLVVQMVETFREHMQPAFVETLDAWQLGRAGRHGAAAGHDLRRRRHPHRSPRKASPTCCCAAATRSASRRSAAWPATPPVGPGARPRAWSRTCATAA